MWATLGPEFSKDARKTSVIGSALYGLKSAGAAFRSHLAKCMESLGYQSCKANPDLWLKPEIRSEEGVCFVDDILCIHHNADAMPEWLHKPDMYLGAKLHKSRLHNQV